LPFRDNSIAGTNHQACKWSVSIQAYFFFVGDGDAFGVALAEGFDVAAPPEIVELPGTTVLVFVVDLMLPEMLTLGGADAAGFVGFFGAADLVATGAG
jgi:hypothetical protein